MQPGHVGIIYNRFGGIDEISKCTEGMNIFIPWFQRPIIYDVRTRPKLINSQSGSKGISFFFYRFGGCFVVTICIFFCRFANGSNRSSCFIQAQYE